MRIKSNHRCLAAYRLQAHLAKLGVIIAMLMWTTSCQKAINVTSDVHKVEWGYEAENGPNVWGKLNSGYSLCAVGMHQSPIDLVNPTPTELPAITFNYQPTTLDIRHNGHTIEVGYPAEPDAGSWIEVDGTRYQLLQFHFHTPSEHTVAGELFDMEMHLVHKSEDGTLAVIGVLIEDGSENAAFNEIWAHLPTAAGETKRVEHVTFNVEELLPSARDTYRYEGSLTTPPCSEGVNWFVMTAPIEMSEAQIAAFAAIIHRNNRPVQPLNGRELLIDVEE